jgi:hypothetical protein
MDIYRKGIYPKCITKLIISLGVGIKLLSGPRLSKNPGPEGPALGTPGRGYNIKL